MNAGLAPLSPGSLSPLLRQALAARRKRYAAVSATATAPMRAGASRSGRVLPAHPDVSDLCVFLAIRLAVGRRGLAEAETRRARLAERPAAGERAPADARRPARREDRCPGLRRLPLRRREELR